MFKLMKYISPIILLFFVPFMACNHEKQPSSSLLLQQAANQRLVVVSYGGGTYQQSHIDAFIIPFQKAHNIKVDSVVWGAEYGRLLEMVRSKNVPWDVVEVTAAQYTRGLRDNIYEQLRTKIPPSIYSHVPGAQGMKDYGVPNVYWSTVLTYRSDAYSNSPPSSWSDFWDVKTFPGMRALYDDPRGNLEFALLADGIPKEKLYPLDIDRAFNKLGKIKRFVRLWWKDGTQPVNALLSGRVSMSSAWSGRIFASNQAKEQLRYIWNGAAHELDYWVIPRHARNPKLASEFILFASSPEAMANQAEATAYGPANALALEFINPCVRPYLPTEPQNWTISFVIDSEWWAQNEQQVMERWISWKND